MAEILITGAMIVTMDDAKPAFFRGDLLVDEDRIARIAAAPLRIDPAGVDKIIDGRDLLVIPGLINTHGHAAMTLFRGYADDLPLIDWLEKKIWPVEAKLESDDVYWGTLLSIAEMLKGGTTTFTDMYFFMERVAEAAAESGIRAVLARGLIGVGDGSAGSLAEAESFIDNWHGRHNGLINVTWAPHAPYTCPPDFLKQVIDRAAIKRRPLQIHLAETAWEVDFCREQHGCTPVELMEKVGLFELPVIAAHCVHLSERDIEILAANNAGVAHNPGSNLKLGSGIAPVKSLLAAGINVGLGTDGAGSNNNLDLFEEMRLAALLPKGLDRDPTLVPAGEALCMATVSGARVLNLPEVGMLREGCKADLVALRLQAPHLSPLYDPLAHLVYAAGAADVRLVIVDGRILLEEGRLTTLDEEKIIAEATRRAFRLTGREPV